jgi:putative transposase
MKTRRTAHTVYQLAYHFVWIPKFRAKILGGAVGMRLKEMILEVCAEYDWEVGGLEVMEEHVHLFLSCPPRYAPAQVMNILKSLTARELYEEFPKLRKAQWSGRMWADGYYVGSSGEQVTDELIQRYIEYQKKEVHSQAEQLGLFDRRVTPPNRAKRK